MLKERIQGLDIKELKEGFCFVCRNPCDKGAYIHYSCGEAIILFRAKRIEFLINHYGDGTLFINKLIKWSEHE